MLTNFTKGWSNCLGITFEIKLPVYNFRYFHCESNKTLNNYNEKTISNFKVENIQNNYPEKSADLYMMQRFHQKVLDGEILWRLLKGNTPKCKLQYNKHSCYKN